MHPFHLAIPVDDLEVARNFYGGILGCAQGRSDKHWVDFNFYGHQLVIHEKPNGETVDKISNSVDGQDVPVPHFGVVLSWEEWERLAKKLRAANIEFAIEPYVRFKSEVGEQATMFFYDPSNNALEFKAFKNRKQLFAK
ncbi:MAG: VOC family protein [Crocinitomicaceae bacterium]|nr:VOC family protein [Crocinitomicaceae bacterium]